MIMNKSGTLISFVFLIICSFFTSLVFAQKEKPLPAIDELSPLSVKDSFDLVNLPKLVLPEGFKGPNAPLLPYIVDNSLNIYWRPVFAQVSMECGQASGVGLGFTYTINRERDLPSDVTENQYPTHFVWNWANGGDGYYGVSYFHSFEVIRILGTPNVVTYGGMNTGGGTRWMTGYENYYSAMHNRLTDVYKIDLKTEEGILTAKHWLHNHLENSATGGIANFYTNAPGGMPTLPPGTPEAGKYVVTSWGGANHGLTIAGYHDSICWDYNNDGQYTNDIDLNGDSEITPQDWEIGGFRFANTYSGGPSFGNNGFCYMTYKSCADPYGGGGIWDNAFHVIYAKADCNPLLTAKITLYHSCREQIRVRMGVTTDLTSETPDFVLGFPIFDFQGSCKYMQGGTVEEDKTIEFGLDLTPFIDFIGPNTPARYFLLVDEVDPNNWSIGKIVQFSLMDYTGGVLEIPYGLTNVNITNNSTTKIWIEHTVNYDPVEIITDSLPPATVYESYTTNIEADGGTSPYLWDYDMNFTETNYTQTFPMVTAQQLSPGSSYVTKTLDFTFPFYDTSFASVRVYADGYIMFENEFTWPYSVYDFQKFTKNKYICPFKADLNLYSSVGDGVWYEGNENYAIIRWNASVNGMQNTSDLNFAVRLEPDGDIIFYYGTNDYTGSLEWMSAVSAGDNKYYQFTNVNSDPNIPAGYVCDLKATHRPAGFGVSRSGEFHGLAQENYDNLDVKFRARDENNLTHSKVLYFSTDGSNYLVIDDYSVTAGDDNVIGFGETVNVSVDIKSLGEATIYGANMQIFIDDMYISLTDSTETLGNFEPGEVKTYNGAFVFDVDNQVPDDYDLDFNTHIIDNTGDDWASHIYLTAYAPELNPSEIIIIDGENGGLDPGETADMIVTLNNNGGAAANNILATLSSADPYVTINDNSASFNTINPGSGGDFTFNITAAEGTPVGYIMEFEISIQAENDYSATGSVFVIVGLITEGFESGGFTNYPWSFQGDAEWIIDNTVFYEGLYSAKSGDIEDDQSSAMQIELCILNNGEISFYKKVSSEATYDFLRFYIDGTEKGAWDGEVNWSEVTFPVTSGVHTFKWTYEKDYSVSTASDCGWVDYITFPPFGDPNPQLNYTPETFIFTIGNEMLTDTLTLINEGTGPIVYTIAVADTSGNSIDWVSLGADNGGVNAEGTDDIQVNFDATGLEEGNYQAIITITDHMNQQYLIPIFMLVDIASAVNEVQLSDNFRIVPNPFKNLTSLQFDLQKQEAVTIGIYDFRGSKIKSLLSQTKLEEGKHHILWDATNDQGTKVEPGIYFYKLETDNEMITGKILLQD
jgi:hypothetical protein